MSERLPLMSIGARSQHGALIPSRCSPYPGSGIDISDIALTKGLVYQQVSKQDTHHPLLHITPPIFQYSRPHPFLHSPYRAGNLDINGGAISVSPDSQPVISSSAYTAVLHTTQRMQHIHVIALRVRDRSGKPGADERRRGPACPAGRLAADSPTRGFARGTPKHNTHSNRQPS